MTLCESLFDLEKNITADDDFDEIFDELHGFTAEDPGMSNICPSCGEMMLADSLGEYICKCGSTIQIYGDLDVDGNHDSNVNTPYASTGEYIGYIGGDSSNSTNNMERMERHKLFTLNNKRVLGGSAPLPVAALCETARRFVQARSYAALRGRNQHAMKELFLIEALKNAKCNMEPKQVAEFLGIDKPKRAYARSTVNSLVLEGKIMPVNTINNDTTNLVNRCLEKLEIDIVHSPFIVALVERANTALLQASAARSKCIGAIWILIIDKKIDISATTLATALEIKQNTFINFAERVMKEVSKFQSIFTQYDINIKLDMNKILAKKGTRKSRMEP
jgi:hypothetical protein